jgi:preprotein translocase subunit SecB
MEFADFRLMKVDFSLNNAFKEKEPADSFEPEISINHLLTKESKELIVLIGIRKISGNVPYYFEVRAGGLFKFEKLPAKKLLNQYANVNCPAIIFPYIRETVADLTRRAGFTPLHLNPINFVELAKQAEKEKKD